jgi:O-antigen ligase
MNRSSVIRKTHIPPSTNISEAQISSTELRASLLDIASYFIIALLIVALPLFMGGKDFASEAVVKLLCFSLLLLSIASGKISTVVSLLENQRGLTAVTLLCFLTVSLQLLPLPLTLLSVLSPQAAESYRLVGATSGTVSLLAYDTLSDGVWLFAMLCLLIVVAAWQKQLKLVAQKINVFSPTLSFNPYAIALILGGMICGAIALAHWASGAESYFGIFGELRGAQTRRAHWPFVNPNHLSIYLQASFILCFGCFLDQCSSIKQRLNAKLYRRRNATGKQLRSDVVLVFAFGLSCFFLAVSNLLTASRMGNVLLLLGASILLLIHLRCDNALGLVSVVPLLNQPLSRKARRILVVASTLAVISGVIAITGQAGQQLAQERLAYGLTTSFDDVRLSLFRATLDVITNFGLLGAGLGAWHIAAQMYVPNELAGFRLDYAHNDALQFVAEMGLLGLAILAITCLAIIKNIKNHWSSIESPTTPPRLCSFSDSPIATRCFTVWWTFLFTCLR